MRNIMAVKYDSKFHGAMWQTDGTLHTKATVSY